MDSFSAMKEHVEQLFLNAEADVQKFKQEALDYLEKVKNDEISRTLVKIEQRLTAIEAKLADDEEVN